MSQIKVNLYCIVTHTLKSYVTDFNLRDILRGIGSSCIICI